ncbi:MAG: hypothetical protein V9G24_18595 [Rhodoblastus sp.]
MIEAHVEGRLRRKIERWIAEGQLAEFVALAPFGRTVFPAIDVDAEIRLVRTAGEREQRGNLLAGFEPAESASSKTPVRAKC